MAYYIYSNEPLPNEKMMGKSGYTPDGDYIRWNGAQLPVVPEKKWTKLPDSFTLKYHRDWRDAQGYEVEIPVRRFKGVIDGRFAERGVIFLDHEPSPEEAKKLEAVSLDLNMKFRRKAIEFYEDQRDQAKARQGTYSISPYVDECYDVLGMKKPYSLEALESLRDPGAKAAKEIGTAIREALSAERDAAISKVVDELTKPEETKVPAARR